MSSRETKGVSENACRGLIALGIGVGCTALGVAAAPGAAAASVAPLVAAILVGVGPNIISAIGHNAFDGLWSSITAQLKAVAAKRQLPENHDWLRALRRAHLLAIRFCVEQCRASIGSQPPPIYDADLPEFLKAAADWIEAQLKLASAKEFSLGTTVAEVIGDVSDVLIKASADGAPNEALERIGQMAEQAAIRELADGVKRAVPDRFTESFFGRAGFSPGWRKTARALFAEILQTNDKVRTVAFINRANAILQGQTVSEEHLKAAIEQMKQGADDLRPKLDVIEGKVDELLGRDATQLDRSSCTDAFLSALCKAEVLDNVTRQLRMAFPRGQVWSQTAAQVRDRIGTLTNVFYGRTSDLKALDDFVSTNRSGLLIVTAPPGSGKSALMAHWMQRRIAGGDVVARHFASTHFDRTTTPEVVLGHLIVQLREADDQDPGSLLEGAEALGQLLYSILISPTKSAARRIVVLDGLDEASAIIHPFVEANITEGTFVIVSGRAEVGTTPQFLRPWADRHRRGLAGGRIDLGPLAGPDIRLWLQDALSTEDNGELSAFADSLGLTTAGLPLFIRFIVEELPSRFRALGESATLTQRLNLIAELPTSFEDYIRYEIQRAPQKDEAIWTETLKSLFAVLSQLLGPIRITELQQILPLDLDLDSMPLRFRRWLAISESDESPTVSLAHRSLGQDFARALGKIATQKAAVALVSWARNAWRSKASNDALFRELGYLLDSGDPNM